MAGMTVKTCNRNSSPPHKQDDLKRVEDQGGGENPNGIMESYHFLTGEDLEATAKANGLK